VNAIETAKVYASMGLSVLRVQPAVFGDKDSGKRPVGYWRERTRTRLRESEIGRLFRIDDNVGIVCGDISGVIAVDGDSENAVAFIRRELPVTPMVSTTGKGEHHFFKSPGFAVPPGAKLKGLPLDLRGDGSYVVAPPSKHYTGRTYTWVHEPTREMLKDLPVFEPTWLAPAGEKSAWRGRDIVVDPLEDRAKTIRRALGAVMSSKTPEAIAGQYSHNRFFSIACLLTHDPPDGFGLSEQEALPVLMAYNTMKCKPGFNDKEVAHKLSDAIRKKLARTGATP